MIAAASMAWRAWAAATDALAAGPRMAITAVLVTFGTSIAVMYHYVMAQYLHRPYPYSTFLYAPADRFADYFNVYRQAEAFHPGESAVVVYSPFLHATMSVLTAAPDWLGFVVIVTVFLGTLFAVLWRIGARNVREPLAKLQQVLVVALFAYPVLMALDRGNLELIVFVFIAAFFHLYFVARSRACWIPLALAIASKYYWATLLVLPLLDRRYRAALYAFAGALVVTAASTLFIVAVSGYSVGGFLASWVSSLGSYAGWRGSVFYTHHGHGFWGVLMLLNRAVDHILSRQQHLEGLYMLLMLAIFVLLVVRLRRGRFEAWEKAAVLVACALLMPYENADYTLVEWMLVFALFAGSDPRGWRAGAIAVLFAVTMIPFAYYYLPIVGRPDVAISTLVYPAALVATCALILTRRHDRSAREMEGGDAGSLAA